jgi:hypothetical protein
MISMRHAGGALLALLVVLGSGCKKPTTDTGPVASAAPVAAPAVPVDHVPPGSLAPGTEKAFALVLPLGFARPTRVERTSASIGVAQPKQVVTYIKERVRDGKLIEGKTDDRTVFDGVRIPDEPDRYLRIVVTKQGDSTLIDVTDVTPPPALPNVSQTERYKQVGLDPQGRLLHPKTLE